MSKQSNNESSAVKAHGENELDAPPPEKQTKCRYCKKLKTERVFGGYSNNKRKPDFWLCECWPYTMPNIGKRR